MRLVERDAFLRGEGGGDIFVPLVVIDEIALVVGVHGHAREGFGWHKALLFWLFEKEKQAAALGSLASRFLPTVDILCPTNGMGSPGRRTFQ